MIIIKRVSIKNFLSIGAVTQTISLDSSELTLILGENLDLGGDGARNGVGKSALIHAVSYALFGQAISSIKKDNLINRTNGKNMLVTIEFSVRGINYKIIRGRKPNILRFFIDDHEQTVVDDSQGDSRETQDAIEQVLCMTHDMFRQTVVLNTYNEPFLGMRVSDQRAIIEQLLGITLLSEKAESIKELNKTTRDLIQQEEYNIRGLESSNRRIAEQIESLKKRQRLWRARHREDLALLEEEYTTLRSIDIEAELLAHKQLAKYNQDLEQLNRYNALLARQTSWLQRHELEIKELELSHEKLCSIDITTELANHVLVREHKQSIKDRETYEKTVKRAQTDVAGSEETVNRLLSEINELENHRCFSCGQSFHDDNQIIVLEDRRLQLNKTRELLANQQKELKSLLDNPVIVTDRPTTYYSTESQAVKHNVDLSNIKSALEIKRAEKDPYREQLNDHAIIVLGTRPVTVYDTESQAQQHRHRVASLEELISSKKSESDPYEEQIAEMEQTAIVAIDMSVLNELNRQLQHQDFLLDLLTNKKSFVRKRIIDQNLGYLNLRLTHYLDKMGLPHQVVFQNDLSVEITELGRDLDFYNLSRGEMNRLVLSLSFAFRDVFESLYCPINIMFIDELLDSGMDSIGTENGIAVLKDLVRKRNKSIWLISHKDELSSRVNSLLKVVKKNGFTNYDLESNDSD